MPVYTLGLGLAMTSCSSLVNEEQMEQFFADLGNTSITIYPTCIKRMAKDEMTIRFSDMKRGISAIVPRMTVSV